MKKGCSIIAVIGLIVFLIGGYFAFNFLKKYKLGNVAKEGYILVPTGANFEQVLDSISPYLKNKESFKEVALKKKIKILKGKYSISSFPIFRDFLHDCPFLEYYLHLVIYMPPEL